MNAKSIGLLFFLCFLFTLPCYAEPPGALAGLSIIFLLMVIGLGLILGFLAKVIFFYSQIESVANWQIFLASTIAAFLILFFVFK